MAPHRSGSFLERKKRSRAFKGAVLGVIVALIVSVYYWEASSHDLQQHILPKHKALHVILTHDAVHHKNPNELPDESKRELAEVKDAEAEPKVGEEQQGEVTAEDPRLATGSQLSAAAKSFASETKEGDTEILTESDDPSRTSQPGATKHEDRSGTSADASVGNKPKHPQISDQASTEISVEENKENKMEDGREMKEGEEDAKAGGDSGRDSPHGDPASTGDEPKSPETENPAGEESTGEEKGKHDVGAFPKQDDGEISETEVAAGERKDEDRQESRQRKQGKSLEDEESTDKKGEGGPENLEGEDNKASKTKASSDGGEGGSPGDDMESTAPRSERGGVEKEEPRGEAGKQEEEEEEEPSSRKDSGDVQQPETSAQTIVEKGHSGDENVSVEDGVDPEEGQASSADLKALTHEERRSRENALADKAARLANHDGGGGDEVVKRFEGKVGDRKARLGDEDMKPQRKILEADQDGGPEPTLPTCDVEFSEIIPCLDQNIHKKLRIHPRTRLMEHYERHCPTNELKLKCLIPPPPGYKRPIRWPRSRDEVWQANVPHPYLSSYKANQNWMVVEGDKIRFPGGGTHFPEGAGKYIQGIGKMLGQNDGDFSMRGHIRTVFDVGCGVASFGGYLLDQHVLTLSMAPNDGHQNQVQFALERGIPALVGVMGTQRLPVPSKAFDLAHCSRCRIDWGKRDGILLLEIDRILRPGGLWVWSAPPAYRTDSKSKRLWREFTSLTKRMCWILVAHKGQTAIFQKPGKAMCRGRKKGEVPPVCPREQDVDAAWYFPMETCITRNTKGDTWQYPAPWPARLTEAPARLEAISITSDDFQEDTAKWAGRVARYRGLLEPYTEEDTIRNILDMHAAMGGFAASWSGFPVWVMNAVHPQSPSTLPVIYDRGLLGVFHDWCEPFSSYPRTYDLLHAWQLVTRIQREKKCDLESVVLEMDRLLRPSGFILFVDEEPQMAAFQELLKEVPWKVLQGPTKLVNNDADASGEVVLLLQKRFKGGGTFPS